MDSPTDSSKLLVSYTHYIIVVVGNFLQYKLIVNIANIKIHILESMETGKTHTQRKPTVVMKSFLLLKINTL